MTTTGSDVWGEGLASSGSTLHLVYGTGSLRYRRSNDEGATWTNESTIGSGTLHLTDPIIADGDDVWVVYLDNIRFFNDWCCSRDAGNIWLRHSGNRGATWDAPVRLSTPASAFRLSLAYAAGRLHLVWMDYRDNVWDTYYRRSRDRGMTWDPEVRIAQSTGPFGAERPQVAARGDSVHVTIWDDRAPNPSCRPGTFTFPKCPDTFHIRSTDGGTTWGPIVNVANGGMYFSGRNDIAVAGAAGVLINYNVDVAGETGSKLFVVRSTDNGATWQPPTRLTFSANASDHGSFIGAGDSAYLVWHDDRNATNREIYYRHTPNAGATWDAEEQVSSGAAGDSSTPLNAVTPGYAHVIWIDNRGGTYQVYYRRRMLPVEPPAIDAGIDAATAEDAGPDAGADAGATATDDGGGCGCSSSSHAAPWSLAPLILLVRRRRRSAASPAGS